MPDAQTRVCFATQHRGRVFRRAPILPLDNDAPQRVAVLGAHRPLGTTHAIVFVFGHIGVQNAEKRRTGGEVEVARGADTLGHGRRAVRNRRGALHEFDALAARVGCVNRCMGGAISPHKARETIIVCAQNSYSDWLETLSWRL